MEMEKMHINYMAKEKQFVKTIIISLVFFNLFLL